jgi:MFS family permease
VDKSNFKRYVQFLLIVLAAGSIYPMIYLKSNYQETILAVFNISFERLNIIYSVLGLVFIIGYFPSGLLSDKFSSKKLLSISLLGTSVGGFWFAQIPTYINVVIIFCIWGVFSVFTFWSAHMKLVKLLAKPEEEGRFFGILDGGRGVVEALLASIAIFIFSRILGEGTDIMDKQSALVGVIYMYSYIVLIIAILVMIFVEDDSIVKKSVLNAKTLKPKKFEFKDISSIFKNKLILLLGGIIFMCYTVTWVIYYFGGFLETNINVNAITVGKIMVIVLWMRPIGGILGGFLADKFGKCRVLLISLFASVVCIILLSILPPTFNKVSFYALIILAGIFIYAIRGTYWSLLGDCNIDNKIIGATVGVTSVIGYLPDIMLPVFNSFLFRQFGSNNGYNAYFIVSSIIGIIGIILVFKFNKLSKANV